jgi:hypothetical protein
VQPWHPDARRDRLDDAGGFLAGPHRGVLHRTEGATFAGARGSYLKNRSAPHFTVGLEGLWQHIPLDRAARSLENAAGGVQTNLLSVIQIEIVGFSKDPWPDNLVSIVRPLMIWIEEQTGIQPYAPTFAGSEAYGLNTRWRMPAAAWVAFNGWCGHQHVPENNHWDPGLIPIGKLLERTSPAPMRAVVAGQPLEVDDVTLTPIVLTIPLDSNGRGWTKVPYPMDRIVGHKPHSGTRPGADLRYDTTPDNVGFSPEDDGTVVVVQGGNPGSTAPVWLHVIEGGS